MRKNKLEIHQKKMIKAFRNMDTKTLKSMSSFQLQDALILSALKYRNEINKRLNRIFPHALKRAKIPADKLFLIAEDFHFDHPTKKLHDIISKMALRIKKTRPTDAILDDLLKIEKTIAFIYYSDKKSNYNLNGTPIQLVTDIWKCFPETRNVKRNKNLVPVQVRFDFDPYVNELKFYPDPFASGRLSQQGDPHNFGKKTTLVSSNTFHKPREIFWEYFFFSTNSPLKKIVPLRLKSALFPLEISLANQTSKKINKIVKGKISANFWRNTGYLCGWAALFGITDLHRGNIIVTKEGPVAIDVETAFLPHTELESTGLIGDADDSLKWSTGFAEVYEISRKAQSKSNIKEIIDGFKFVINWALTNNSKLNKLIQENQEMINRCANRFIMRNSRHYENPSNKFITEEHIQLLRGDIPFFFTFRNKKGIYYNLDIEGNLAKIKKIAPVSKSLLAHHQSTLKATISKKRMRKILKESPAKIIRYFGDE
jgi:Domain of unknown function (DUF4135)